MLIGRKFFQKKITIFDRKEKKLLSVENQDFIIFIKEVGVFALTSFFYFNQTNMKSP